MHSWLMGGAEWPAHAAGEVFMTKHRRSAVSFTGGNLMLWTIIAILLILWLLGFTVVNIGSIVHALLVIALIVLIFQLVTGRRSAV